MRLLKKVLILSAFFYAQLFLQPVLANCPPSKVDQVARVEHVYDGDTLKLQDGRKVRLIGIDTPEIHSKKRDIPEPVREKGIAARQALQAQLRSAGWQVSLSYGLESKDRYGRVLAHVYLPSGLNLQSWLLEEGHAIAFTTPPNDRMSDCYREQETKARLSNKGIWGLPAYQLHTSFQLSASSQGFHRLTGRVTDTWKDSKRLILVIDQKVRLKIYKKDLQNFNSHQLSRLEGRTIEVRGWLKPQRGKHPWSMVLRHQDSLTVQR